MWGRWCRKNKDTYSVDHFVRGGETMSSAEMHVFSGGKGLNQSIALSKSGAEVWHAGAISTGDGDFLIRQLKEAGVKSYLYPVGIGIFFGKNQNI